MQDQYDSAFLGILQNERKIVDFLDKIFSFLYRRTDYYITMKTPDDKMGFPPGVAQKLVLQAFQRYETLAKQDEAVRLKKIEERTRKTMDTTQAAVAMDITEDGQLPPAARMEEVTTSTMATDTNTQSTEQDRSCTSTGDAAACQTHPVASTAGVQETRDKSMGSASDSKPSDSRTKSHDAAAAAAAAVTDGDAATDGDDDATKHSQHSNQTEKSGDEAVTKETASSTSVDSPASGEGERPKGKEDSGDGELTRMQQLFQSNPESYNGAIRDHYAWSQSITDVDIKIAVPKLVKRGKDVRVDIQKKRLKASFREPSSGEWVDVVDGELNWVINKLESMWSLVPGECIQVNLEKVQERWWEAVLTDEPHISVQKIDPSRPITDLDQEAQAKIDEMMYNEHCKKMGMPQTHERKVHGMLKKAWDAEGSPFQGQPFDPSKVNVSPNNAFNPDQ